MHTLSSSISSFFSVKISRLYLWSKQGSQRKLRISCSFSTFLLRFFHFSLIAEIKIKKFHLTSLIETPSWKVIFDCFNYQYTILKFDFCNYWFVIIKSNYLALNITDEPVICFNMKMYLIWKDFSSYLRRNHTTIIILFKFQYLWFLPCPYYYYYFLIINLES